MFMPWPDVADQPSKEAERPASAYLVTHDAPPLSGIQDMSLHMLYREKVAPLYHASLDMLQQLLTSYAGRGRATGGKGVPPIVAGAKLRDGAGMLAPQLVHRCGNLVRHV
jgi:hypothetical protein